MTVLQYLDRVSEQDIRNGYDFSKKDHNCEIIMREGLSTSLVQIKDVYGGSSLCHVCYVVNIINADGKSILEDEVRAIQRELYPRAKLRKPFCDDMSTTKLGRVARNVSMIIAEPYRGQGIGFTIYDMEEVLYRKWGAQEVQLFAILSGKIVWRKRGFVLDCMHDGFVDIQYKFWCAQTNQQYDEKIDINGYPEAFLRSDLINGFSMYKEM